METLLVVDLQKQFADKNNQSYQRVLDFVKKSRNKYFTVATIFKNSSPNNQFQKYLNWNDCKNANIQDLEFKSDRVLFKDAYGNIDLSWFKNSKIHIVGCNTDACVLAICYNLFDNGYDFDILTKDCYSSGGEVIHKCAVEIMKRAFGTAVIE